jgi:4-diphosphocytidyl-2-C-methyl-D-erythritol kinase
MAPAIVHGARQLEAEVAENKAASAVSSTTGVANPVTTASRKTRRSQEVEAKSDSDHSILSRRRVAVLAHAKLNLCLSVGARRPDGFHEISSVMCSLDLADRIEITRRPGDLNTLAVEGQDTGPDLQNLALKGASLFQDLYRRLPSGKSGGDGSGPTSASAAYDISLFKTIPVGSGLGGGSADAAGVLHGANWLSGEPFSKEELARHARVLGSDVPFCVVGGLARVGATGEVVVPLSAPPDFWACFFVVAVPDFWMSTSDVYAAFDRVGRKSEIDDVPGALEGIVERFANDLEGAAEEMVPGLKKLRRELSAIVGSPARLTGSGSAIYAVATDGELAKQAADDARRFFSEVFVCRPSPVGVTILGR